MNLEKLHSETSPSRGPGYTAIDPSHFDRPSPHLLEAQALSSSTTDGDWLSPLTLPPLPALGRERERERDRGLGQSENLESPEHTRLRSGSGAYYAAVWGSPYATPSPRRSSRQEDVAAQHFVASPPSSARQLATTPSLVQPRDSASSRSRNSRFLERRLWAKTEVRNPRSERPNWLSGSEDSGSETGAKQEDKTPTRTAYLDDWGTSSVRSASPPPRRHRISESLATITPYTFNDWGGPSIAPEHRHRPLPPPWVDTMAEQEHESVDTLEKPPLGLPHRVSTNEGSENATEGLPLPLRPRPTSIHSSQQPKKKSVRWRGKACIIALPLTDREATGLPPLLTPEDVKKRIAGWIEAGFNVNGFELTGLSRETHMESSGQSRPVYPDPTDLQAERKLRHYHVHIPNQAEWEQWVSFLKEEKLRALGVSPSNSEAPPSTRSPFSPPLSRVSSGYLGHAPSPPIASPSAASNPLRATSNPFSPSLMSSAGISPQSGSLASPQFNGMQKPLHGYKQSVPIANPQGRIASPFDSSLSHSSSFSQGARPNLQPLSSRQNSFSPNHSLQLPNLGEVLSPSSQQREQSRHGQMQSQAQIFMPTHRHVQTLSPGLPQLVDARRFSPDYHKASPPPIEIAHPTPKSHRHNLSMALQREIDEAEAASRERYPDEEHDALEDPFPRKNSNVTESVSEEPPILRRPETISTADERSEIETNPSIAATPLLIDDKNPFVNWQALSDAAKAEPQPASEAPTSRLNVEAKEFDPRAGFSSSNFSFGGGSIGHFGLTQAASALGSLEPSAKARLSLNADAPAFTPSFASQPAPKAPSFNFSSATFNVEAPVFNPSQSLTANFKSSVGNSGDGLATSSKSIFGNVVVDSDSKVSRRTSKTLPPKVKEIQEPLESDDDSGRPMAPADRQKRARKNDSDGDRSPTYADSAPFHHARILSEIVDDVDQNGESEQSPKKPFEGWAYIPADETQEEITLTIPREQKGADEHPESNPDSALDNQDATSKPKEEQSPLGLHEESKRPVSVEHEPQNTLKEEVARPAAASTTASEKPRRAPKSSLSALAKPFQFNPELSSPDASSIIHKGRKAQGLEASRYATTSSPRQSSPDLTTSLSSPPADLYHYQRKDSESVDDTTEDIVEVFEESSTDDEVQPRPERESSDPPPELLATHEPVEEIQLDVRGLSMRPRDEPVPSFEEIDAVMKQFEVYPELGIERNDTPVQSTSLVNPQFGGSLRSDAPSPSPPRPLESNSPDNDHYSAFGRGIGVHNLNTGRDDISDWGDTLPAEEEAKVQLRSQFFDGRVNDLVDGILENRLGPLERTLQIIQESMAIMSTGSKAKSDRRSDRRSMSTDRKNSDADDEDDYDAFEGFSSYRTLSPMARRDLLKQDKIRAAVAEALAAYQPPPQPPAPIDVTEFNAIVHEMRQLAQQTSSRNTQDELKTIMEDVISQHPRLRGSRVQQDHDSAEIKYKPQIDGLETMLKISKEHASEEARLKRQADEEVIELKLRLRIAEEEAAQYRESSEEAQQTLQAFVEEKKSYHSLEDELDTLTLKNTALETTLEEYRVSSDQWREDIRMEREKNKELRGALQDLQQQVEDQLHSRKSLRTKVEILQAQLTQVAQDMHAEQADWRQKEHELVSTARLAQNELEHEQRHREKAEEELELLDKEHKTKIHAQAALEQSQQEVSRLNELVASLREENRALDTKTFNLDRELAHTTNSKEAELATATSKLQAELESAKTQLDRIRTDSEAQISRLQSRLDHAELDIEDQKAKHDALLSETIEAHKEALREANEKRESALEDQHLVHEKKLNDLRDRHTRELHNSFDNRTRLEHQLNERLSLGDDKVKHLESKVADLEERLQITKSAARAAVEAATAKGVNLPTPAPSVVASPPQRAASASMPFVRGTEVPEKISPQALRESIMVLQDQLQNREQNIEKLEAELAAVDREAPNTVKERDTEIAWLRELLNVRVDDLQDIISAVSQPDFDRETVKDATIRLKANLQMEQQLRERSSTGLGSSFPSISTLSSYAQSPRALPMAAAAAWGNWRRARDSSLGALSDLATNLGNQTPSKSAITSPAGFLSGMITPPGTTQRTPGSVETPIRPPSMRPLAAAAQARKSSSEARPLRVHASQPRALSSRQREKRPESSQSFSDPVPRPESPHTPVHSSPHSLDLTADVDDDASLLDGRDTQHLGEPEPVERVDE